MRKLLGFEFFHDGGEDGGELAGFVQQGCQLGFWHDVGGGEEPEPGALHGFIIRFSNFLLLTSHFSLRGWE